MYFILFYSACCTSSFPVSVDFPLILSFNANAPASNVPEIECHVHDTAQIIADSGVEANWAVVVARLVASPAFAYQLQ